MVPWKLKFFTILCLTWSINLKSQPIPVDFPYVNQPALRDSITYQNRAMKPIFSKYSLDLTLIAPSLRFLGESRFPFKQNTGEMLPGVGPQTLFQTGAFISSKHVDVQIKPSILWASNQPYDWFPDSHSPNRWKTYSIWYNFSDQPPYLYKENHFSVNPGQSYIQFKYKGHGIKYSNESFFWGPGFHNSLLLSNQGEPFQHVSIQSLKPIETKIGNFNYEIFGGHLKNSIVDNKAAYSDFYKSTLNFSKNNFSRYLNGIQLSFRPRLFSNLEIGFQNLAQQYQREVRHSFNYLPSIVYLLSNKKVQGLRRWSYYQSWSLKWTHDASGTSIYGEWGRKGPRRSIRAFMTEPRIATSYLFGSDRVTPLNQKFGLYTSVEGIFTARRHLSEVRDPNSWYLDFNIPQGHTHRGQWLGSGIGPGSNRTVVDASLLIKHKQKIGLLLDRRLHNADYYYFQFERVRDYRRYWVDHGFFIHGSLDLNFIIADFQFGKVFATNYQWEVDETNPVYFAPGRDIQSYQGFINLAYLF